MRSIRMAWLAAVALAVLPFAGSAWAQLQVGGMALEGEIETGVRFFVEEPSASETAKFEEYRDITEGLFLERLQLRIFRPDESYSVEFEGSKWGQEDQEFALRAGRLGVWQFDFSWDQTPHIYSTNARMRATEAARGVFVLPPTRPSASSLSPAEGALYNAAPILDEVSVRWDTARMGLTLTPTSDLDLRLEYTRINKDGDKPIGVAFGSPGNDFMEVLEPIEHTIHDVRLRGALARQQWQLQFGYTFSLFQNALESLTADNPLQATDGAFSGTTSIPGSGTLSLPPDNMAHTWTLAGGVNLPLRTRVNANASYSLRLQNEDFLPHTRNPNIVSPGLALPQSDLNGLVGVALFNLQAMSRPWRPLALSLKYRLYDFNEMSDEIAFPAHVVNDRTLVAEERVAGRFEYTRHNLDLDGRLRPWRPLALTVGTGWERWDRNEHREVPTTDEIFGKAKLDWTPNDWLLARLSYRPSIRRIDEYNTFAHLAHTVPEEELAAEAPQSQSTLLRKFDQAERNRHRADLLLQLMPTDTLSASISGGWRDDDYFDSTLGLQHETTWSAGVDLNWTPVERLSLFAGYVRELIFQGQRSQNRDRTFTAPVIVFNFDDHQWISVNTDTVDTAQVGANMALIPRVLDWSVTGAWSYALGEVSTRNPVAPTSGSASQNANATARKQPAFEDQLIRVDTALKYHFWKAWTAKLGYAFESFEKNDWRTDTLNPFMPGSNSIWLGSDLENYTAHILALTIGYRFK